MTSSSRHTLVSAPGKVLLAGGYLVLDPAYPGVVIATSSRFYSLVQPLSNESRSSLNNGSESSPLIRVRSHQFVGAEWVYYVRNSSAQEQASFVLTQTTQTVEAEHAGKNPFVGLALLYALRIAAEKQGREAIEPLLGDGLDVFVMGDNDFYSQRETLAAQGDKNHKAPTTKALRSLSPFAKQSCPIREVHKTGLGSSAAMTTSLVGALLVHLDVVGSGDTKSGLSTEDVAFIHNVAQLAHCAAQGKVGSGFDVSAAVWGSQVYRRFEPKILDGLMGGRVGVEGAEDALDLTLPALVPALAPSNVQWRPSPLQSNVQDGKNTLSSSGHPTAAEGLATLLTSGGQAGNTDKETAELLSKLSFQQNGGDSFPSTSESFFRPAPIALPPHLSLVLADVDAGSNTPSMVGKVMKWRKEKPEWAAQLYAILAAANQGLADVLLALSIAHVENQKAYEDVAEWAATVPSSQWEKELKQPTESATVDKDMLKKFVDLRHALRSVRGGMRELGMRAECPVEPEEMGRLIQKSVEDAPGVAGGGVPGAGGYDALYLIHVVPPSSTRQQAGEGTTDTAAMATAVEASPARRGVEAIWAEWSKMSVGPLLSTAGSGLGLCVLEVGEVAGVRDALGAWLA
ncbi:unnamed protein product [Tilletia controversa]|uniref:phosphomevalonate kinase n=3 Tax=Tilletia TaxID=13289 RepID=A0A8X7MT94_9BASI|nr:hypothetical protein CF336_g3497 [Tilletia laevis]KAE8199638.1 hypothetical protein CF328_g3193 [Tilletia controversa]KAE8245878.1 hypothetical protein A4X03_0g7392 [Tilletia caries]KAE8204468.1 hypothetical protein CF335_g2645 [Tilletia laevis]KAE8248163.1 hypothetical protein A4X06_0g3912 [Tilletia controversa]